MNREDWLMYEERKTILQWRWWCRWSKVIKFTSDDDGKVSIWKSFLFIFQSSTFLSHAQCQMEYDNSVVLFSSSLERSPAAIFSYSLLGNAPQLLKNVKVKQQHEELENSDERRDKSDIKIPQIQVDMKKKMKISCIQFILHLFIAFRHSISSVS